MNKRVINFASAFLAASVAVGAVSAHDCGSENDISLQSPTLTGKSSCVLNSEPVVDVPTETGTMPVSYGRPSINIDDYTVVLLTSYTDIAAEYGTNPADVVTYDGSDNWISSDTVLLAPKEETDEADASADEEADIVTLATGDKVIRISYTDQWSLIKLEDGTQGYVKNDCLSSTAVTPVPTATPSPTPTPKPDSSSSSGSSSSSSSSGSGSSGSSSSSSSSSSSDYSESPCDFTVYASCYLNARSGPGISYACVDTLPTGTDISVVAETDNGWYKSSSGFYVKASLTQEDAPEPPSSSSSGGSSSSDDSSSSDFASYIKGFIGCKYVYGGSSPSGGFDCSGLVMYCYQQYYDISLPHGATSQSYCGYEVSADEIQVGDIICFDRNGDGTMEHSALYVGNDTYVHAKGAAYGVVSDSFSSATGIAHIRRVL